MQLHKWICAYSSVIGNSHITENIPCQDFCSIKNYENFMVSIVSDGAGSCINSDKGSKQVCEYTIYYFENEIKQQDWYKNNDIPSQEVWHSFAKCFLLSVKTDLELYSNKNDLPFKSLSCTVIIVIAIGNALLVTHIGDGRAGYCNQEDEWFSMITPFHGREANETVFITSDIWHDDVIDIYIESRVITENVKAFCLLSDGCEKASFECNLYDSNKEIYFDPNTPFKEFFHRNVNVHLPNMDKDGKTQEQINELWHKFLTSGNPKLKIEPDDKTMILAVKSN